MRKNIFSFISLCFIVLFTLTGCGNKKAITYEEFKTKMEGKGFKINDLSSNYTNYNHINHVLIAVDPSTSYQLEFYDLIDNNNAVSVFNQNKTIFESSKTSGNIETSINMGNNSKYTLKTNGKYKVVSRIDNTIIYVDVDSRYENSIKDVLKDLGY